MNSTQAMLFQRMEQHQTLLCCGLDPDLRRFPSEVFSKPITDEEKVVQFLHGVVDVTAAHVCAYKAQKAFFDLMSGGHDVLKNIVAYIHDRYPGIPVIIDCKIGDIENTMQAYLENLFRLIEADGIVVNPYIGEDVITPCKEFSDKMIVVLVKTSNQGGASVQNLLLQNGRRVWEEVLELVVTQWNDGQNLVPVVSSTALLDFQDIRQRIPDDMAILLAGVGAQGGSYDDLRKLLNSRKLGVFINSSRGILYPAASEVPWWQAVQNAAVKLKDTLNQQRR